MAFLWRRFRKPKVLISVSLLLYVLYCEYFQYNTHGWPKLDCGGIVNDFHKILFVADPQILGENTESFYARMDCDRYLRLTFLNALNYVKPDLTIFLGDLMDEGSTASNEQYERYYRRFTDIFQLDRIPKNQTLFIPGDNDIGGEDELVTEFKIKRFQDHFQSSDTISFKNMKFFQVNSMTKTFPQVNVKDDTSIRIIISHIPLLGIWSTFGEEAIDRLKPTVIFSAHDHKLMHLVTGIGTSRRECVETLSGSEWRFDFHKNGRTNEIVVPTCSYRMGTHNMGFGVALLSTKGDVMCYYMLWSPQRLLNLQLHLFIIASLAIVSFIYLLITTYRSMRRNNAMRYTRLFQEL